MYRKHRRILGFQPRDKAAMLVVNTIQFFFAEFALKQSLAPSGENAIVLDHQHDHQHQHLQTR